VAQKSKLSYFVHIFAQLREVDYWIAMSEEVGRERLVHEGMPDGQKTKCCK